MLLLRQSAEQVPPELYSVTAGSLPNGLSLDGATGEIFGTQTVAGAFTFTITVTDAVGAASSQAYRVTINPSIVITTSSLANGSIGALYNQTLAATRGTGAKTFAVTSGALPDGLSLSSVGVISGIPSTVNTYSFTVTATDSVTASVSQVFSVLINPKLSVVPNELNSATVGNRTHQTITIFGGTHKFIENYASLAVTNVVAGTTSGLTSGSPTFVLDPTGGTVAD